MKSEHVLLDDLLATYDPVYGDTWEGARQALLDCPSERLVVDVLVEWLRAGNEFSEPVRLDDDSSVVGNGTHRVVASMIAGQADIRVTRSALEGGSGLVESLFRLEAIPGATQTGMCCGDEPSNEPHPEDFAFTWLRSVPLADGSKWATSDLMCSSDGVLNFMWWCDRDDHDELLAAVAERCHIHGWKMVVESTRTLTAAQWDAELDAEEAKWADAQSS